MDYKVEFTWDDEAGVWVATSDEITGLVLESESLDDLMKRVRDAVPELIELNHLQKRETVCYSMYRQERMAFA